MTNEKRRGQGSKQGQGTSTPPARDRGGSPEGETRGDRHRVGETSDAGNAPVREQASGAERNAERRKPEETEIERAQEDETNMGHPDRPYT